MKASHMLPVEIRAAVITVSTSRTLETDDSGKTIKTMLAGAGIEVAWYTIVTDEITAIQESLRSALERANCIIFCGGTGLTSDDCTIEAVYPFIQKRIDGFGEIFRYLSFQEIGTAAILSRARAGIIDQKVVFCVPGSSAAARLAMRSLILPEIGHILSHARR
ncbi:MAG: MogA/MoaB family molybdenum cofactor biosynthesis protein [Methanomicrobiales archaeon]|nr:MogA/MoaB family molybdenum cofactor biosynthesis protein [Methanomicrobiales archaeon]